MCGIGKMRFANGVEYKGQFENGMANWLRVELEINPDNLLNFPYYYATASYQYLKGLF
jgi:hypothetical protein